jgi:hypothetical protein
MSHYQRVARKNVLTFPGDNLDCAPLDGVVAQLVERLNGIQEVRSSSLLGSTSPESFRGCRAVV